MDKRNTNKQKKKENKKFPYKKGGKNRTTMKYKLLTILLLGIFLVAFASAIQSDSFIKDNLKINELNTNTIYGTYTIEERTWWDLFSWWTEKNIKEATLKNNTDICEKDCYAITEINNLEEGSLIDDVRFYRIYEDDSQRLSNIRSYQFYIKTDENEYSVDDYEYQCSETGGININGTKKTTCKNVIVGSHMEKEPLWIPYTLGETKPIGTYTVKLQGSKRPSWSYDWQVLLGETNVWTNAWATWGNISLGDDAEVILNSPADESTTLTSLVTFNATGNVTGGASLVNMSLWTNETGSWISTGINRDETTYDDGWTNQYVGTGYSGMKIVPKADLILNRIYLQGGNINCSLLNSGKGILKTSTVISNSYCEFNYALTQGTTYYFSTYGLGNYFQNRSMSFPEETELITITGGLKVGGDDANEIWGVKGWNVININSTQIFNKTITDTTLWNVQACDSDGDCGFATENRTFSLDQTIPIFQSISGNGTQDYGITTINHTINFSLSDTNINTCWYDYNETNTTFSCSSGVNDFNFTLVENNFNLTLWANDSVSNTNSTFIEWDYKVFDFNDYTYDLNMTESSTTTFKGKFKTGDSLSSSYLQYNNTNYSTSISSLGDNTYTLSSTVTSPSVSTDTNITWFFWVNGINTTAYNQTVLNVNLDDCSSYSFHVVNYTLVDELTQENINNSNSTIESSVILKTISGEEIATFNKTFNGTATASICSENNLNTSSLRLWEQSRYGSQNHVFEQHNIQNASITSLPREIVLRDLPSTSATTFRIAYKSATFLPIESAVINIQRKYIGEGIFKIVEAPLTDTSGETSASLDLNSVLYRIVVSKNGETLSTFENPAIACDNLLTGDCSILINERESATLIDNIDIINDFSYGFNIDNRTMTLTFEIPSGENSLVNLFVNQSTILGNQTSCNQTLYATSGQLQCIIDNALGDVYTNIYVYKDGVLIGSSSETIFDDRSQYFGTDNIVLTFFLVLSLVLLMISSPITVLIGLLIGLISSSLMLFLNAGSVFGISSVLTYIVVIIILLIVKISGRER